MSPIKTIPEICQCRFYLTIKIAVLFHLFFIFLLDFQFTYIQVWLFSVNFEDTKMWTILSLFFLSVRGVGYMDKWLPAVKTEDNKRFFHMFSLQNIKLESVGRWTLQNTLRKKFKKKITHSWWIKPFSRMFSLQNIKLESVGRWTLQYTLRNKIKWK